MFRDCRVNNITVSVHDNVLIQQTDKDEDEERPPAIGNLLDLYQSVGKDPNRAKIKWYFLHEEVPKALRTTLGIYHYQSRIHGT